MNVTRMGLRAAAVERVGLLDGGRATLDLEVLIVRWIRMLLVELNRMASHLLFQATNA
jgi:NADH:ubiquinone oxidoreductase subunit D